MQHISEITDILKEHCPTDKRLLKTVALMVCALLQMHTVNMKQLAPAIAQGIKPESAYRKLQRLMNKLSINSWLYRYGCCHGFMKLMKRFIWLSIGPNGNGVNIKLIF